MLATDPPTLMTKEECFKKIPYMKAMHLEATNHAVVMASTGGGKYKATQSGPQWTGSQE
jgi:hypothetical protein